MSELEILKAYLEARRLYINHLQNAGRLIAEDQVPAPTSKPALHWFIEIHAQRDSTVADWDEASKRWGTWPEKIIKRISGIEWARSHVLQELDEGKEDDLPEEFPRRLRNALPFKTIEAIIKAGPNVLRKARNVGPGCMLTVALWLEKNKSPMSEPWSRFLAEERLRVKAKAKEVRRSLRKLG